MYIARNISETCVFSLLSQEKTWKIESIFTLKKFKKKEFQISIFFLRRWKTGYLLILLQKPKNRKWSVWTLENISIRKFNRKMQSGHNDPSVSPWRNGKIFFTFFWNFGGKFVMVAFAKKRPWFRLGLGFNLSPFHFLSYDWKSWIFELHNRSNHLTTRVLSSKHSFYNFNFIFTCQNFLKRGNRNPKNIIVVLTISKICVKVMPTLTVTFLVWLRTGRTCRL